MDSLIEIRKTSEFEEWHANLRSKEQIQVDARLLRIQNSEHFGDAKSLGEGLAELRWKNGWRVYFCREASSGILLLLGGNKNAQDKDIQRARVLLRKYAHFGD